MVCRWIPSRQIPNNHHTIRTHRKFMNFVNFIWNYKYSYNSRKDGDERKNDGNWCLAPKMEKDTVDEEQEGCG